MLLAAMLATVLAPSAAAADPAAPLVAQSVPQPERYVLLRVVSPVNGDTIHDNAGNVPVAVTLRPALRVDDGHRLRVLLDDALAPGTWQGTKFTLQGVNRGTHTLRVFVTDADGRSLIESEPVEFTMWQASRLFPNRRGGTP